LHSATAPVATGRRAGGPHSIRVTGWVSAACPGREQSLATRPTPRGGASAQRLSGARYDASTMSVGRPLRTGR
jgi:hypothetical protein